MPITSSAKKALRQNVRRKKENLKRKTAYKAAIKNYKKLLENKDLEKAKVELSKIFKALDKAAKKDTIKKNKANRLKSRLSKKLPKS